MLESSSCRTCLCSQGSYGMYHITCHNIAITVDRQDDDNDLNGEDPDENPDELEDPDEQIDAEVNRRYPRVLGTLLRYFE